MISLICEIRHPRGSHFKKLQSTGLWQHVIWENSKTHKYSC